MAEYTRGQRRRRARSEAEGADPRRTSMEVVVPRWLPALTFSLLGIFLFRAFVFSDRMLYGGDTLSLGYVARALYAEALGTLGSIPKWAPEILGGTPFLEALSAGDSLYPPSLALLVAMEPYRALGWKLVLHVIAAGFFMFGWVRSIGASRAAALFAGTAYMLSPFFVSLVHPGHDGKIFVTALAPLLFWAVEGHFVRPGLKSFSAIALLVGMILLTTHFQMAYFLFGGIGLFAIFRTVRLWREGLAPRASGLRFALFLAAAMAGAGVGGVQLFPAVDYVMEHSRRVQTTRAAAGETGAAWSSSWSIHPEEAMSLVVPEFAGNNARVADWTQDTYWGRNLFKDNHEYAGLVALLLAAISFLGAGRRPLRWFFAGLGAVALLFALGPNTPIWRISYEIVPGIRLFRAPSQAIFLFGFGAITLAALGLDRILETLRNGDTEAWRPVLRILAGTTAGLAVLALLISSGAFTSAWTSTIYSEIDPSRLGALQSALPFMTRGAWIAVFLSGSVTGLVWAAWTGRLGPRSLVAGVIVLAAFDALRIDAGFIETLDFYEWSAPDRNIRAVLEREQGSEEPYRLLSFRRAGQDVRPALHGIELAAGHHPNDLSRYRELIGMVGSSFPENLLNPNVRGLLNVRYILWPDLEMGQSIEGPVVSRTTLADGRNFETILADGGLPRARLVGEAVVLQDDAAVPYILSEDFDPEREVVLADAPGTPLAGGPVEGTVRWVERTPDRLHLQVEASDAALLVVADNWYPAWQATVNGEEAPVLRAYHTLRAVPIPAGSSAVIMTYRSRILTASSWLSLVLTLLCGAGLTAGVLRDRRQKAGP